MNYDRLANLQSAIYDYMDVIREYGATTFQDILDADPRNIDPIAYLYLNNSLSQSEIAFILDTYQVAVSRALTDSVSEEIRADRDSDFKRERGEHCFKYRQENDIDEGVTNYLEWLQHLKVMHSKNITIAGERIPKGAYPADLFPVAKPKRSKGVAKAPYKPAPRKTLTTYQAAAIQAEMRHIQAQIDELTE